MTTSSSRTTSVVLCLSLLCATPAKADTLNNTIGTQAKTLGTLLCDTTSYVVNNYGWTIALGTVSAGVIYFAQLTRNAYAQAVDRYDATLRFTEDTKNASTVISEKLRQDILRTVPSAYPLSDYVNEVDSYIWYLNRARTLSFNAAYNQNISNLIARLTTLKSYIMPLADYREELRHRELVSATMHHAHLQVQGQYNLN